MSKKRCAVEKVISILRHFHLVGLAEAKENTHVRLDRTRRCSMWCVSVNFCGFLLFFFFEFRKSSQGALWKISGNCNICEHVHHWFYCIFSFDCLFVCLFFFRVTPACALTFMVCVIHFFRNRWHWQENNAIQQWKTRVKISTGGFITRLYSATAPTDSIHGKKKKFVKVQS